MILNLGSRLWALRDLFSLASCGKAAGSRSVRLTFIPPRSKGHRWDRKESRLQIPRLIPRNRLPPARSHLSTTLGVTYQICCISGIYLTIHNKVTVIK